MRLANPPIVELWIEFRFDPAPNSEPWGSQQAQRFFNRYGEQFPELEIIQQYALQVRKVALDKPPEVTGEEIKIAAVRARNADGSRWLQLAPSRLVYNMLRTQEMPYPGFEVLSEEALAKLADFVADFRPAGLAEAAIHYVDLVEIPIPDRGILRLEDYLNISVNLPEQTFGPIMNFVLQTRQKPSLAAEPIDLRVSSVPASQERKTYRLRLDWHTAGYRGPSLLADEIRANLRAAHEQVVRCFQSCFTDTGWKLFGPSDGE